jgi:AcrR family transcriptional regulator
MLSPRTRDAHATRRRLLQSAFSEIHKSGFRGADVDAILQTAGVTKGALYYHFDSKEALGYAVVDDVITAINQDKWVQPLKNAADPITALLGVLKSTLLTPEAVACGCPLNNLAQEMSPLDEGFRKRLAKVFKLWHDAIADALLDGQKRGLVRRDLEAAETATFLIAVYEGYISLAKNSQNAQLLREGKKAMIHYVESLRAIPQNRQTTLTNGAAYKWKRY